MIKAVLFDYGGVLCAGGGIGSVRQMLADSLSVDPSTIQDMGDVYRQAMTGTITTEQFIDQLVARHAGSTRPTVDVMLTHTKIFNPNPEVYELAERLRVAGIKTGILSNVFAFGADEIKRRGLFDGFDPVLLSCDVHLMKPDPAFYQMAVDRLGVAAHDILFIDDRSEMLAGAEQVGLQTLLAKDPAQIVDDTARLLREQNTIEI
jgi:epoxide hydrolase-like predicted phosphatase